ncbi:hypothetical protein [Actinokineospora inagensis]|uniref:hypothetical protein n=1 Tax=Actinokineospora inagensis TaxID=103730 RepID=UPI0003F9CF22|nr:hypothetical protein [Actinokineospora inagensis]
MSAESLRLGVVQLDGIPWARTGDWLWRPAEPLLTGTHPGALPNSSAGYLFAERANDVYQELQEICAQAAGKLVGEVLAFLTEHEVDLAVFPEYLVPLSYLPDLITYARGRAVVAGLGLVRNEDEAAVVASLTGCTEDLVDRNIAVLVHDGAVTVVTKGRIADDEHATSGSGPALVELTLRGRTVTVGVAVCKDFLGSEDHLRDSGAEIVCVPALTGTTAPFIPDAPRDYVRLLANIAQYGGSQVIAPMQPGPLNDRDGTWPLPAGRQGVTVVDYRDYPTRPTPIAATPTNKLLLRAEIIERTDGNELTLAAIEELAKPFSGTTREHAAFVRERHQRMDQTGPAAEAVRSGRTGLAQGFTMTPDHRSLAFTHLPVAADSGPAGVRKAQVRRIMEELPPLIVDVPDIGRAIDVYRALAADYQLVLATHTARITVNQGINLLNANTVDGIRTEPTTPPFRRGARHD